MWFFTLIYGHSRTRTVSVKAPECVLSTQFKVFISTPLFTHSLIFCLSLCLQDPDWDTTFAFLPASDSKHLEKKPGRRKKLWIGVGLVVAAAALSLLTGLLVWHFHCELISTTFINTDSVVRFGCGGDVAQSQSRTQLVTFHFP